MALDNIKKLIDKKFKLIESSPEFVVDAADSEQKRLLKELMNEVTKIEVKDGQIVLSDKNLALVDDITKKLKKGFYKSDYSNAVEGLVKDLDIVKDLTKDYMNKSFGKFNSAKPDLLMKSKKKSVTDALLGQSAMDTALFNPIQNILLDGITNNSSLSEVVDSLRNTVTGDEETDGKLKKYSRTIAYTSFAQSSRAYTSSLSGLLGVEWYRYVGGTLPDSRCFCLERNNNYYHINEILEWGQMKGLGDCNTGSGWAGMITGTNESNILSNAGGYNCIHDFVPVSESAVPLSDLERAIEKGWYNPDEETRDALGL